VPYKPDRAGIDPYHLLVDWETDDNVRTVRLRTESPPEETCQRTGSQPYLR
jgi:hypothetical protein